MVSKTSSTIKMTGANKRDDVAQAAAILRFSTPVRFLVSVGKQMGVNKHKRKRDITEYLRTRSKKIVAYVPAFARSHVTAALGTLKKIPESSIICSGTKGMPATKPMPILRHGSRLVPESAMR